MAQFSKRHPHVATSLQTGNSARVLERILKHDADIAVIADVPKHPAVIRKRLHRDRVVLVVNRRHAWNDRQSVAIKVLASQRLIEREQGSRTRAIMRRALAAAGIAPETLQLSSREAVMEAAALGLGVGAVFETEISDVRVHSVRLRGSDVTATEYIVYRRERRNEPAIIAFRDALQQTHG